MKVKFFKGFNIENQEDQINEWLKNNPNLEIIEIKQSSSEFNDFRQITKREKIPGIIISIWFLGEETKVDPQ